MARVLAAETRLNGVLLAVFVAAAVLSFTLLGGGSSDTVTGMVETPAGTFEVSFFKMAADEKLWTGFTVPVAPDTDSLVGEPSYFGESRLDDYPVWHLRTNSHGIRDEPVEDAAANTTRILVLGNSVTMGSFVNESDRFTELLQARLNRESDRRRYRVINAGVPGAGMFDQLLFLQMFWQDYRPDIIVSQFVRYSDVSRAENRNLAIHMDRAAASEQEARVSESTVEVAYLNRLTWATSDVRAYGADLAAFAREHGMTPVFLTTENVSAARLETYAGWAAENGAVFVGPPPRFAARERSVYRFADGHYRENGHRWLADHLYAELDAGGGTGG